MKGGYPVNTYTGKETMSLTILSSCCAFRKQIVTIYSTRLQLIVSVRKMR